MTKNIFYIDQIEKETNTSNFNNFDTREISLVLSSNTFVLMKYWIKFQQEWISNIYKQFKDHDKYIILIYLIISIFHPF